MKLGHYMKIDPRTLFWAQFAATIWGSLVQIAVLEWAYGAIDNLCAADQKIITHVQTVKFSSMLRSFGVSLDPNVNSHMGRFIMGYFSFHHWCCDPVINWLILKNGQTLQSSICIGQCSFLGQGTFLQPLHITIPPTVLWACSLDGGLKRSGSTGGLNTTIPCLRAWILVWHGAR